MDICYFSDLHLEFMEPNEIQNLLNKMSAIPIFSNTVCLLAGDIGNPRELHYDQFFQFIHQHFPKTFVIPGNHEYYHPKYTVEETDQHLHQYFQQYDNITLLKNSYEIYRDHCFVGSVLWSHIFNSQRTINDVHRISGMTVEKYNALNQTCVEFLQQVLSSNDRCIVLTHHMPSERLIDTKYRNPVLQPYNQWFYCNVEHLFLRDQVKAWVYGHTHTSARTVIRDVPLYCNTHGYMGEKDTGFDYGARFTVE